MPKAKIDLDRVLQAAQDGDGIGFCTACGAEQGACEPDARNYECESCGALSVFGAEELLLMTF